MFLSPIQCLLVHLAGEHDFSTVKCKYSLVGFPKMKLVFGSAYLPHIL